MRCAVAAPATIRRAVELSKECPAGFSDVDRIVEPVLPGLVLVRQIRPRPDLFENAPKPLHIARLGKRMAFYGSDE